MDAGIVKTLNVKPHYALLLSYADASLMVTVLYDYVTHLSEEVELIWSRKFTFTSTLYLLMRYIGIIFAITLCLYRLPVSLSTLPCETSCIVTTAFKAVLAPLIQGLMALRVYVLYEQCKSIAILLFVSFVVSQATALTGLFLIMNEETTSYRTFDGLYCSLVPYDMNNKRWIRTFNVSLVIPFETLVCALAMFSWFTRYRSTCRRFMEWSVNNIIATLIRDNIVYFLVALICMCLSSEWALPQRAIDEFTIGAAWYTSVVDASQVIMFSLCGPHIILNICRYHARNRASDPSATTTLSPQRQQLTSVPLQDLGAGTSGGVYTVHSAWSSGSRSGNIHSSEV
ncbi:hypothetical protein CONPUDRAFT_80218 [Coniophora puteana RWD-64-598 SS2]|uniref:DUF6533 domain-containing protein n=1 Tax=Coniophora puteana (strain RWD-64-598) TaxID=741705 RepID=A0A5M3N341_CONPW|nr:uncharacterized protein CONPUDRAFT_80218 [Coniophora puteana RWD-64-598 SS2]EIW85819.1 hypothetical protein CONPUDRAFT_80218 [Coniophora puteana RWD-64-598 SS2]